MNKFEKAAKSRTSMKLAIAGPSGSGKTYSSLQIAEGLVGDLSKVAVLDSENGSAHLYAHLGDYSVLSMKAPFTPEAFVEAIHQAEKQGFQCLIIDSLSASWEGLGGILHIHSQMPGNSFQSWASLTPRQNHLIQAILQSPMHIICTMRSKQEYVVNTSSGKAIPEKIGMKPIQRDGIDYEFSVMFEIGMNHVAQCTKDRTGHFRNKHEINLNTDIGKSLARWCQEESSEPESVVSAEVPVLESHEDDAEFDSILEHILSTTPQIHDPVARMLLDADTVEELDRIYSTTPEINGEPIMRRLYVRRKNELLNQKHVLNGVH